MNDLCQIKNAQEPPQREPSQPITTLLNISVIDILGESMKIIQDLLEGFVIPDLDNDFFYGIEDDADEGEYDQLGDDEEGVVTFCDCFVES